MGTMIEKVARAVCEAMGEDWHAKTYLATANGQEPEDQREYWRVVARSAMAAMREPTPQMMDEIFYAEGLYISEPAWSAAIDAALSDA